MKKKLTSALAVLMAVLTVVSFSSLPVFAENEEASEINVTFSLMGDAAHGSNGTHYNFYNWISPESVTVTEGTSAAELLTDVLDKKGFAYSMNNGYFTDITSPGGCKLAEYTNGGGSGWMYAVNGSTPMVGAADYLPKDGDTVTWFYVDNYSSDPRLLSNKFEPEAALSSLEAQWDSYHANNGVVKNSVADGEGTSENFTFQLKNADEWSKGVSDPLVVGNNVYVAAGDLLYVLDSNGEPVNGVALEKSIGYTSRLLYADGIIVVPFANGGLQALSAETLQTLWVTDDVSYTDSDNNSKTQQALTSLTYDEGYIYYGTACADFSSSSCGVYKCVELLTGKDVWQYTNAASGYYWSGAAVSGDALIFAGDDGIITSLNKKTGEAIDSLATGLNGVRSTVVMSGNTAYCTTRDGYIVSFSVDSEGKLSDLKSANFAKSSTCTPTVVNDTDGNAVVVAGGATADYKGILAEIDAATLEVKRTVSAIADVKSAPVADIVNGRTYIFYTANKTPGSLYMHELGSDSSEEIYTPDSSAQNYCMASPVMDNNGHIYYTNDSGCLMSVNFVAPYLTGDADGNGKIELADAVIIQRLILYPEKQTPALLARCDVNGDGAVSAFDAVILLRRIMDYQEL